MLYVNLTNRLFPDHGFSRNRLKRMSHKTHRRRKLESNSLKYRLYSWKRHLAMKTYVWALRRLDPYTRTKHHHPPTTRTHLQLRSVPVPRDPGISHLLLQLEDAVHQSLARRRTARDVDINWHNTITAPRHAVRVVVVTATVRTAAHGYDPSWFRHLIIDLP